MEQTKIRNLISQSIEITNDKLKFFDNDYDEFRDFLFADLEASFLILERVFNKSPHVVMSKNEFQSALLLWKSLNSIICAYQNLRLGFYDEPMVLCRIIVECISVAFVIFQDHTKYEEFVGENLESTKAIKSAKKFEPLIGRINGVLSNQFIHVHPDRALPSFLIDKNTGRIDAVIGGAYSKEVELVKKAFDISFLMLILVSSVTSIMVETLFFRFADNPRFCKMIDNDQIVISHPNYINEHFQRLLESTQKTSNSGDQE